jgi:DNA-3-methyladenine glycosylase I
MKIARLLTDVSIIRNRLKVGTTRDNARQIQYLWESLGSFEGWLYAHYALVKFVWVKRVQENF